jgi:hypothetical protein
MMLARGAGREEMPRRRPSHMLCHSATRRGSFPHSSTRVRLSGDGFRRFGYERSGREQAPAMGYGYRRGANLRRVQALVGMRTVSEPSSVGDDMLCGNPANPMSGTGMQQARSLRCGASRRSGEIPQGRNMNRGRHTAVRTRAQAWVEWTRVGISEEGHPTIPEESDLAPFVQPAMA